MKNLETLEYEVLTEKELQEVNGGIVCGGWCVAGIIVGVASVVAFGVGVYNGYNQTKNAVENK